MLQEIISVFRGQGLVTAVGCFYSQYITMDSAITVSIIVPVHNAAGWLPSCLDSVVRQTYKEKMELSVYNDASTDESENIIESWRSSLEARNILLIYSSHSGSPRGVGFAKNEAIAQSTGTFLCFLDADDVMHEDRITRQLEVAQLNLNAIVGSGFHREPADSTQRFTHWANNMTSDQLYLQVYTSHGPTVIMPTWFCHRQVVDSVGGFHQGGKGTPEDLIFFYKHLKAGGRVMRVNSDLLMYRYHPQAQTFSISEETIWQHRVKFLEQQILSGWESFSIWNAGKQGRKFYRSLSDCNKEKVSMFCDVDDKKIQKQVYVFEESKEKSKPRIPIVHFSQVKPPVVICIKMNLCGNFEDNLRSLHLTEGRDYIHFN